MARKVEVQFTGDSKELKREFDKAALEAEKFAKKVEQGNQDAAKSGKGVADSFDDIRVRARRASSVGPLRLAGIGIGAGVGLFAATQAVTQLKEALTSTGAEALTAEGRLKNVGASLLGGDIFGAIGALTKTATTIEDLGIKGDAGRDKLSKLSKEMGEVDRAARGQAAAQFDAAVAAAQQGKATDESNAAGMRALETFKELGTIMPGLSGELRNQVQAWIDMNAAMRTVLDTALVLQDKLGGTIISFGPGALRPHAAAPFKPGKGESILGPGAKVPTSGPLRPMGPIEKNQLALGAVSGMARVPLLQRDIALQESRLHNLLKSGNLTYKARREITQQIAADTKEIGQIEKTNAAQVAAANKAAAQAAARKAKAQREHALARRNARQFAALGLDPTGQALVPTVKNLKKQFAAIKSDGRSISAEARRHFPNIGKLLAGDLGKLSPDVRAAIRDIFKTIRDEWKKGTAQTVAVAGVNTNALLKGLGLAPDQVRTLKNRLAGVNVKGKQLAPAPGSYGAYGVRMGPAAAPVVYLDGKKVSSGVRQWSDRWSVWSPKQKRGPNAGR